MPCLEQQADRPSPTHNRAALVQWGNPMKTGPEKEAPWAWDANAQQEYAAVVKVNRSFLTDAELTARTKPVRFRAGKMDAPAPTQYVSRLKVGRAYRHAQRRAP